MHYDHVGKSAFVVNIFKCEEKELISQATIFDKGNISMVLGTYVKIVFLCEDQFPETEAFS